MGKADKLEKQRRRLEKNPVKLAPAREERRPLFSWRFVEPGDRYCFSYCDQAQVRGTIDSLRIMSTKSWADVLATGGKNPAMKTGLHYTPYEDHALKASRPASIDPGVTICGFRSSSGFRVFGFRDGDVFFLLWFDPNHEIVPY